jgi:hypothetical protein
MSIFERIVISLTLVLVLFASPAFAETRVALVIGNGAYLHSANLPNPPNDAADVTAALKKASSTSSAAATCRRARCRI